MSKGVRRMRVYGLVAVAVLGLGGAAIAGESTAGMSDADLE